MLNTCIYSHIPSFFSWLLLHSIAAANEGATFSRNKVQRVVLRKQFPLISCVLKIISTANTIGSVLACTTSLLFSLPPSKSNGYTTWFTTSVSANFLLYLFLPSLYSKLLLPLSFSVLPHQVFRPQVSVRRPFLPPSPQCICLYSYRALDSAVRSARYLALYCATHVKRFQLDCPSI